MFMKRSFLSPRAAFLAVMNQYNNLVGRNLTGNADFRITMNSHPFPATAEEEVLTDSIAGVFIGIGACSVLSVRFFSNSRVTESFRIVRVNQGYYFVVRTHG